MEAESIRADVLDLEVTITRCVRSPTETRAITAGLRDEWETCGQILCLGRRPDKTQVPVPYQRLACISHEQLIRIAENNCA